MQDPEKPSTAEPLMPAFAAALLFAQLASAGATPADSAWARAAMDSAVAAWAEVGPAADLHASELDRRISEQLGLWAPGGDAWEFAWRRDSVAMAAGRFGVPQYVPRILAGLFRTDQAAAARELLDRLPRSVRDAVLASMPNMMGDLHPGLVAEIEGRREVPLARAHLTAVRARRLLHVDRGAARDSLAAAIDAASRIPAGRAQAGYWGYELRRWGGDVPTSRLVELTLARDSASPVDERRRAAARYEVAGALANWDPEAAAALADTLLRAAPGSPGDRLRTAALLDIRAAPGDSAEARRLRDSLRPPAASEARRARAQWMLANRLQALLPAWPSDLDTTAFLAVLDSVESLAPLRAAAWKARPHSPGVRAHLVPLDDALARADFVQRHLWAVARRLPPSAGDSARVEIVGLLAQLDPAAALDSARTLAAGPLRDRAVAIALVGLAAGDADRVLREADGLSPGAARDTVLTELAARAVAGGRLELAARLVAQVTTAESRVRARVALARGWIAARQMAHAQNEIRRALDDVDPRWASDPHVIVVRERGQPEPATPPGMDRRLLAEVGVLALDLGLEAALWEWAQEQPRAERRAAAWILLAESMARKRLRWGGPL